MALQFKILQKLPDHFLLPLIMKLFQPALHQVSKRHLGEQGHRAFLLASGTGKNPLGQNREALGELRESSGRSPGELREFLFLLRDFFFCSGRFGFLAFFIVFLIKRHLREFFFTP